MSATSLVLAMALQSAAYAPPAAHLPAITPSGTTLRRVQIFKTAHMSPAEACEEEHLMYSNSVMMAPYAGTFVGAHIGRMLGPMCSALLAAFAIPWLCALFAPSVLRGVGKGSLISAQRLRDLLSRAQVALERFSSQPIVLLESVEPLPAATVEPLPAATVDDIPMEDSPTKADQEKLQGGFNSVMTSSKLSNVQVIHDRVKQRFTADSKHSIRPEPHNQRWSAMCEPDKQDGELTHAGVPGEEEHLTSFKISGETEPAVRGLLASDDAVVPKAR